MTDENIVVDEDEVEEERQRYVKEYEAEQEEMPESIKSIDKSPGSMSFHEAFHTSYVLYSMMEAHIIGDASIYLNKEAFAEAAKARNALWTLYQRLGEMHSV